MISLFCENWKHVDTLRNARNEHILKYSKKIDLLDRESNNPDNEIKIEVTEKYSIIYLVILLKPLTGTKR